MRSKELLPFLSRSKELLPFPLGKSVVKLGGFFHYSRHLAMSSRMIRHLAIFIPPPYSLHIHKYAPPYTKNKTKVKYVTILNRERFEANAEV